MILKQALTNPPIIGISDAMYNYIVDIDACNDQVGCVLLQ